MVRNGGGEGGRNMSQAGTIVSNPDPRNLIFCQNGTHGINLSLKGWLNSGDHVVATGWEHNAVVRPLQMLKKTRGFKWITSPRDQKGRGSPPVGRGFGVSYPFDCFHPCFQCDRGVAPGGRNRRYRPPEGNPSVGGRRPDGGVVPIDVESMGISMLAFSGHKGLMGSARHRRIIDLAEIVASPLDGRERESLRTVVAT